MNRGNPGRFSFRNTGILIPKHTFYEVVGNISEQDESSLVRRTLLKLRIKYRDYDTLIYSVV
jgi:hypothetical protein